MRQIQPTVILAIGFLLFPGCNPSPHPEKISFSGEAQGTYYTVTYYACDKRNYQPSIDSLLKEFDRTASLWVPASLINRVNRNEEVIVNEDFQKLFDISTEVSEATGGSFDITVGPLVKAWGFGPDNRPEIEEGTVDSLLPLVNFRHVTVRDRRVVKADPRMKLDFNAVAQGYSVDLVAKFLESKGIENYLVDIGGEVFGHGLKPGGIQWRVGIEKPSEDESSPRELLAEIPVTNRAVATSGNYRKYYEHDGIRYSHTIDPKTGFPVRHSLLSVTVIADRCAGADAYATAFLVMGEERAIQFLNGTRTGMEAYFILSGEDDGYRTLMTEGLKQSLVERDQPGKGSD